MLNPLAPLTPALLEALARKGKQFFVRQSFAVSGKVQKPGSCFLVCPYETYLLAREHFDALSNDPYRFLYVWEEDKEKLLHVVAQPSGYKVYANLFRAGWKQLISNRVKEKLRTYTNRLGWKPEGRERIHLEFYPHFGEPYVCLKFREEEINVKLEEIEWEVVSKRPAAGRPF